MHSLSRPLRPTIRLTALVFLRILPGLTAFEIAYKAFAAFAVKPALSAIARLLLGSGDGAFVFNEHMFFSFLTPLGILGGLLLAVAAALLSYLEFSAAFFAAYCALSKRDASPRTVAALTLTALPRIKSWGFVPFAVYTLGLLPLVNMGLSPAVLPMLRIPNFITGELQKTTPGQVLVWLVYTVLFALFFLLMFTLPGMVLGGKRFSAAARQSARLVRVMGPRAAALAAAFFAVWCVLFRWPGLVPIRFAGITGAGFFDVGAGLFSGRLLPVLPAFLISGLLRIVLSVLFFALLAVLYEGCGGTVLLDAAALPAAAARVNRAGGAAMRVGRRISAKARALWHAFWHRPFCQKHKKLVSVCLFAAVFFGIASAFIAPPILHAPIAIGHRGSREGVENTVGAVQGAIDAGADYAEIDVLLSADGVPMVIHDTNLQRLAGTNQNVYELTADELSALTLSQNGYTGQISTLEEMLAFVKGRIQLVVELKTHGHERQDPVRRVVQIVEAAGAQTDCLFMSIDSSIVQALHALRPQYTVGYCVYGSAVDVDPYALLENGVDFLTIEENMAQPRFISRCLRTGLPVYVWTVNDADNMALYLENGACGIVSDEPGVAVDAVSGYWGDSAKDFFLWQNEW